MGYYTDYSLAIRPADAPANCAFADLDVWDADGKVRARLEALSGYDDQFEEARKWYEHDEHMLALSVEFPGFEFRLSGEGEESGDVWTTWYRAGQKQEWRLTLERPDYAPEPWA